MVFIGTLSGDLEDGPDGGFAEIFHSPPDEREVDQNTGDVGEIAVIANTGLYEPMAEMLNVGPQRFHVSVLIFSFESMRQSEQRTVLELAQRERLSSRDYFVCDSHRNLSYERVG
jgi:hypothetical protein